ncbi:uncharacterized protein LOC100496175 isoform X1 [Xenopus tropicalis]|uniref:Uncharacterized protein LOC100496175 isoform X1 n=1 Tax=Xenopus tropicalis TaxID=8364 RepID=A0A8J1IWM6_XENTR|nr:uncharacterized protein LOC100496175 isoform X1 [Xenopus tropicalis]
MAAGRRVLVGIFSRESEESYKWLINILISFKEVDVRPVLISNSRCLTEDIGKCDVAILYHSQNRGRINITDVTGSLYDEELKLLSKWLGKENIMVVVDDLTETNQELKNRILQHQPSIGELATELFLFSVNEKSSEALMSDDFRENKMKEMENIIKEKRKKKAYWKPHAGKLFESVVVAEVRDDQNLPLTEAPNLPQKHREAGLPSAPVMASNRQVVGFFSRDAPEKYDWLIRFLLNLSWVRDVRPVDITNKSGNVRDEASRCTFAILYHSMGGRGINANSETDPLYDRDLEGLSSCLGRDGVIMVIDDLEDSSLEAKHIFLKMQPSIGRWAVELFLFSDQEKTYQRRLLEGNMMAQMETLIKNKISRRGYSDSTGGALTHRRPNRQPSIPEPSIPKPSIPKPSLPKPSIPGLSSGNQNSWTIYLPVVFGFVLAALVVIFK